MKTRQDNATVYGNVTEVIHVLQMSSPGFGWVDVSTDDDFLKLEKLGQEVYAKGGGSNFRVIRRLTMESVVVPHTDFHRD